MAKTLAINVNMFSIQQQVTLINENGEQEHLGGATANRLGEYAASFANSTDIDEIRVIGQKDFAKKVVADIKEYLGTKYSDGTVRIYLNGEVYN